MSTPEHPPIETPDVPRDCTKCGQPYPRTLEHFPADKKMADGMGPQCRSCRSQGTVMSRRAVRAARRQGAA